MLQSNFFFSFFLYVFICLFFFFFFFNDTATTEIYTLSLHDALPIYVERHVLLGLPADHLTGVGFLHPVHLDLLDDDVPASHRRDDRFLLHPGRGKQPPDRLRDDPGVHDLALDDGVGGHLGGVHLGELRLAAGVVDHHQLDDAGADIEADGGFFATQEPK